jgi:hypothetical protein
MWWFSVLVPQLQVEHPLPITYQPCHDHASSTLIRQHTQDKRTLSVESVHQEMQSWNKPVPNMLQLRHHIPTKPEQIFTQKYIKTYNRSPCYSDLWYT